MNKRVTKLELMPKRALIFEKINESFFSTLPIIVIVAILCLTIAPVPNGLLLSFFVGALMIVIGMGIFTLGADISMTPIGNRIGTTLTKSKNLPLILIVSFILGVAITATEPDLQVLAQTVPSIENSVLIITVGIGVGLFLSVCMIKTILGIKLKWLLLFFYAIVFIFAFFTDKNYLSVAFDSGGVTTGPMTVPFILALGIGVSNVRSDNNAGADSFGLVSLCSIGPILAVLILSFIYRGSLDASMPLQIIPETSTEMGKNYLSSILNHMLEMATALSPIIILFLIFQFVSFRMNRQNFLKIIVGIFYTYFGLVLFLTGVNVGFSPLGLYLGKELAGGYKVLLIPLTMLMGYFIISAEPAVFVLEKQIEQVSSGAISGKAIKLNLSIAISLAYGLAMIRVLTGISILWFVGIGYAIALILMFFVPDIFTAIAFDSGGVASGPMTASFMLQFFIGACFTCSGNILTDAFGLVSLVAIMPLISIQILGIIYKVKMRKIAKIPVQSFGDMDIIELWGE